MKNKIIFLFLACGALVSAQPVHAFQWLTTVTNWFKEKPIISATCLIAAGICAGWLWRSYKYQRNIINDYVSQEGGDGSHTIVQRSTTPAKVSAAQSIKAVTASSAPVSVHISTPHVSSQTTQPTVVSGASNSVKESLQVQEESKKISEVHRSSQPASVAKKSMHTVIEGICGEWLAACQNNDQQLQYVIGKLLATKVVQDCARRAHMLNAQNPQLLDEMMKLTKSILQTSAQNFFTPAVQKRFCTNVSRLLILFEESYLEK